MKLAVVIPVFNEEEVLPTFYQRLTDSLKKTALDYELIFVNDGSRDRSLSILLDWRQQDNKVHVIDLSRNFGHQIAITAGIDHCTSDGCLVMDADLQDPPEVIPEMIAKWQDGYQVVHAHREDRASDGLVKRSTAFLYYHLMKRIANVDLLMQAGDFCLLDKTVLDVLKTLRESHRYLRGLNRWIGFRQGSVSYVRPERYAGRTKFSLVKMIRFAMDGITSFSIFPLQIATYMGFLFAGLSGLCLIYSLYVSLIAKTTIRGWTSLIVVVLFLGGVQLFSLGVMGEYLGRIYEQVRQRPLYVVKKVY